MTAGGWRELVRGVAREEYLTGVQVLDEDPPAGVAVLGLSGDALVRIVEGIGLHCLAGLPHEAEQDRPQGRTTNQPAAAPTFRLAGGLFTSEHCAPLPSCPVRFTCSLRVPGLLVNRRLAPETIPRMLSRRSLKSGVLQGSPQEDADGKPPVARSPSLSLPLIPALRAMSRRDCPTPGGSSAEGPSRQQTTSSLAPARPSQAGCGAGRLILG